MQRSLVAFASSLAVTSCLPIRVPDLPPARPEVVGQSISRADALADIDTLIRVLEDVHPDLYAVRSRDAAVAERSRIIEQFAAQESRTELWMRLAPFVSRFGDGHTTVYMPAEDIAKIQESAPLFPANVALDPDGHLATTAVLNGAGGMRRGDRVLSINGYDADSLLHGWMAEFSGESPQFRAANVVGSFRTLAVVHGIAAPFTVEVIGVDSIRRSIVAVGITEDSLRAIVARGVQHRAQRLQSVTYDPIRPHVGYLDIRGFDARPDLFADRMKVVFTQIASDSDRTLLVDLRANGGGDSRLADELLRHFTTTAYRMNARKDWKMSAEYRAFIRSWFAPPLRWVHAWALVPEGRNAFEGPDGKIITEEDKPESHARAEPFFGGNVCVLIGPGTFSAASDLADAIKTYHLAALIGDETGGRVNTFGEGYDFRLPKSQLAVQVSSAYFVRANGDTTDHRGVVPDVLVRPTTEDRSKGRDAVVETAIEWCRPKA